MERVFIAEQIDSRTWIGEIAMTDFVSENQKPWLKDGVRVHLDIFDIWTPTKDIIQVRE